MSRVEEYVKKTIDYVEERTETMWRDFSDQDPYSFAVMDACRSLGISTNVIM